jgi:hypothetical protein
MTVTSLMAVVLCLLLATACGGSSPTAPGIPLEQRFTLAPGETAAIDDTSLRVQFLQVTNDSRCPADAICILGGDALVHIRAQTGGTASAYELHTGDGSRGAVTHSGFHIALVDLQPYPFSSRQIQPGDYRATLRVSR